MTQFRWITTIVLIYILLSASLVTAQTARPTPTNEPASSATATPSTTNNNSEATNNGSIRGTIYEDQNRDGQCSAGDPTLEGIPLRFVSNDGETTLFLKSGADGTYGLVAAGYGTWQVSAEPAAPWSVTSTSPLSAFIDGGSPVATGVNFCLSGTAATSSSVLLPNAGAATNNSPLFIITLLLGFSLLITGYRLRKAN